MDNPVNLFPAQTGRVKMNLYKCLICKTILFVYLFVAYMFLTERSLAGETYDWRADWGVADNFELYRDTGGYEFPTSIAFVPEPGRGGKDPLYFVTELRGSVKVITNDRSVYTFAEGFTNYRPLRELPEQSGEAGAAGICLDPVHGYVFVTFTYEDGNRVLRNNIARFETEPGRFSLKPVSMTEFKDIFQGSASSVSHQIGPCQVDGDNLYVSVGDAYTVTGAESGAQNTSRSIDSVMGKVLRMTLDGKPVESNPFYVDGDTRKARNYVWARGFRNPFGLKVVDSRVFAADNGPAVDRFTEVRKGEDYLWDGTNWSIGANSDQVFSPATGVTQLEFVPEDSSVLPEEYRGRFYLTLCGFPSREVIRDADRGIVSFPYGFGNDALLNRPKYLLKHVGEALQMVVGLALGPDGLYFLPLYPDAEGNSYVLKIIYKEGRRNFYSLERITSAFSFMKDRGCLNCHTFGGYGLGREGPPLDKAALVARVEERINSPDYASIVDGLDKIDMEPYRSFREARREVMEKQGLEKVRAWIKYRIMEPRFDNPGARMPNMSVTEANALMVADYLLTADDVYYNRIDLRGRRFMQRFIPELKYRHLVYFFALGISLPLILLGYLVLRKKAG